MAFGLILFSGSLYLYAMDVPIARLLFGVGEDSTEQMVGEIGQLKGAVRRKKASHPDFRNIPNQEKLFNYDTIVTGPEGGANLRFNDGSEIELGPKTMIQLEFESNLTFAGFDRATSVNIVSGRVKGKVKSKKLILKSRRKKVEILTQEQPKVIEVAELTIKEAKEVAESEALQAPLKVVEEETESNDVDENTNVQSEGEEKEVESNEVETPTSEEKQEQEIKMEETLKTEEKPAPIQKPLQVTVTIPKPNQVITLKPIGGEAKHQLIVAWQANISNLNFETALKKNGKTINTQTVAAKGKNTQTKYILDRPGQYSVTIASKENKDHKGIELSVPFELKKTAKAIQLFEPLIAGQETASNLYTGDVLEDFDITLRWTKFDSAKEYVVSFYKERKNRKPILTKKTKNASLTMNKKKIFKGKVFYQVKTQHPNGFLIYSIRKPFRFDFLPPVPKYPKNKAILPHAEIEADKGEILFTWQKTNFTDYYQFEISSQKNFKKPIKKLKTKENFAAIKLRNKGRFWWRVRSFGQGVYSAYTPIFRFQIK